WPKRKIGFVKNGCCRRCAAKISVMHLFRGLTPTAKRCRRCAAFMPALPGIEVRFRSLVLLK
ncbi:MAG: hypothetical protein ABGX16_07215, partial [Pirellulales bacterium]